MRVSENERQALIKAVEIGKEWEYGNVISHLMTAWAKDLAAQGFPESGAHGGAVMPFGMQEDILQRGFWDHTGKSYLTDTKGL